MLQLSLLLFLLVGELSLSAQLVISPASRPQLAADTFWRKPGDTLLLDALGQVYALTAQNELIKLRSANQVDFTVSQAAGARYRNVRLGQLTSVDLTNPIRPLLFYGDAQTVVFLQRNLGELRQFDLLDFGIDAVDAVAYAPNQSLWVFAPDRQQLLLLDQNGNITAQSNDLSRVFRKAIRAKELVATPQQVTLATDDGRLLIFGPFGVYRTQLLQAGTNLIADEKQLLFHVPGGWLRYTADFGVQPIELPETQDAQPVSVQGELSLWRSGEKWWLEQLPAGN